MDGDGAGPHAVAHPDGRLVLEQAGHDRQGAVVGCDRGAHGGLGAAGGVPCGRHGVDALDGAHDAGDPVEAVVHDHPLEGAGLGEDVAGAGDGGRDDLVDVAVAQEERAPAAAEEGMAEGEDLRPVDVGDRADGPEADVAPGEEHRHGRARLQRHGGTGGARADRGELDARLLQLARERADQPGGGSREGPAGERVGADQVRPAPLQAHGGGPVAHAHHAPHGPRGRRRARQGPLARRGVDHLLDGREPDEHVGLVAGAEGHGADHALHAVGAGHVDRAPAHALRDAPGGGDERALGAGQDLGAARAVGGALDVDHRDREAHDVGAADHRAGLADHPRVDLRQREDRVGGGRVPGGGSERGQGDEGRRRRAAAEPHPPTRRAAWTAGS